MNVLRRAIISIWHKHIGAELYIFSAAFIKELFEIVHDSLLDEFDSAHKLLIACNNLILRDVFPLLREFFLKELIRRHIELNNFIHGI